MKNSKQGRIVSQIKRHYVNQSVSVMSASQSPQQSLAYNFIVFEMFIILLPDMFGKPINFQHQHLLYNIHMHLSCKVSNIKEVAQVNDNRKDNLALIQLRYTLLIVIFRHYYNKTKNSGLVKKDATEIKDMIT